MYITLLKNIKTNKLSIINEEIIEKCVFKNLHNTLINIIKVLNSNGIKLKYLIDPTLNKYNKLVLYKAKLIKNINDIENKNNYFVYIIKKNKNNFDIYSMDNNFLFNKKFREYIKNKQQQFNKFNNWIPELKNSKIYYVELIKEIIWI